MKDQEGQQFGVVSKLTNRFTHVVDFSQKGVLGGSDIAGFPDGEFNIGTQCLQQFLHVVFGHSELPEKLLNRSGRSFSGLDRIPHLGHQGVVVLEKRGNAVDTEWNTHRDLLSSTDDIMAHLYFTRSNVSSKSTVSERVRSRVRVFRN